MKSRLSRSSRTRPRVAMVSTHGYVAARPELGATDTGGQVVYVLELSKQLGSLGYDVDIWTRQFEAQPSEERVSDSVRIVRVPCGGEAFIPKEYLSESIPEWTRNALGIIRSSGLKYRFLDSHYWDGGLAGGFLNQELGVPHLFTPHSLGLWKKRQMERDYPDSSDAFERQYNFEERIHQERLLAATADGVVATTPEQQEMLIADYGVAESRCPMIPPGYQDHRFFPVGEATRQAIRRRLGFTGKVVLALGRLARNKGYDLLLNGFAVLARREPEAVLHLAVGGTALSSLETKLLGELKELVESLGLSTRVRFGSFIPDEELADHYRAADEFVLSSRYEPFGMTAIEAMACGTPTVITVHGGLWKFLTFGRNALFADPFDSEDLGITMLKPFRFPRLRDRLCRVGAYRARSLFTWTGIAHQLVSLVEDRALNPTAHAEVDWDLPWADTD